MWRLVSGPSSAMCVWPSGMAVRGGGDAAARRRGSGVHSAETFGQRPNSANRNNAPRRQRRQHDVHPICARRSLAEADDFPLLEPTPVGARRSEADGLLLRRHLRHPAALPPRVAAARAVLQRRWATPAPPLQNPVPRAEAAWSPTASDARPSRAGRAAPRLPAPQRGGRRRRRRGVGPDTDARRYYPGDDAPMRVGDRRAGTRSPCAPGRRRRCARRRPRRG